jgi:hypothetical protein
MELVLFWPDGSMLGLDESRPDNWRRAATWLLEMGPPQSIGLRGKPGVAEGVKALYRKAGQEGK